jgi:hypothetical protein
MVAEGTMKMAVKKLVEMLSESVPLYKGIQDSESYNNGRHDGNLENIVKIRFDH